MSKGIILEWLNDYKRCDNYDFILAVRLTFFWFSKLFVACGYSEHQKLKKVSMHMRVFDKHENWSFIYSSNSQFLHSLQ